MFALTLGFLAIVAAICVIVPRVSPDAFEDQRDLYRKKHQTLGCRVTHMFGIPMLAFSIPMLLISWQWALGLFVVGSVLQVMGHFAFEGNNPVLATSGRNWFITIVYAVIFVTEEWISLLTRGSLNS